MAQRRNDEERQMWVENFEPLYLWKEGTGLPLRKFVRDNREAIDAVIDRELAKKPVGAR